MTAKANKCAREGRPLHFHLLGIAVRELTVYLNSKGIRPLGPLPAAQATFERLPPAVIKRSFATQAVLGIPAPRTVPRAAITVITRSGTHRKVIEGQPGVNRAEEHVKDFNALVSQVLEEFRHERVHDLDLFGSKPSGTGTSPSRRRRNYPRGVAQRDPGTSHKST